MTPRYQYRFTVDLHSEEKQYSQWIDCTEREYSLRKDDPMYQLRIVPTDDTVARMLGVTQAQEVPADATLEWYRGYAEALERHGLIKTDGAAAPTLNRDATVAVSPTYTYNEDMSQAPRGVKLILLGASGVAVLTEYNGKNPFWVGWAALPRRAGGGV